MNTHLRKAKTALEHPYRVGQTYQEEILRALWKAVGEVLEYLEEEDAKRTNQSRGYSAFTAKA